MSLACLKSSVGTLSFSAAFSESSGESGPIQNRSLYQTRDGHIKRRTEFHRASQPPHVLSTGADRKLRVTPSAQLTNGRPSRMVPIEEALGQVRGDSHVGKNGAYKLPRMVSVQPPLSGAGNGATNGSANGAANGAAAHNESRGTVARVASVNGAVRTGSPNQNSVRNVVLSRPQAPLRYPSTVPSARTVQLAAPPDPTLLSIGNEPIESELRVLPSDETFKWAKDKYNKRERSFDVWSFVLLLRARLFLLDAKWSYVGGFTEGKQKNRRRAMASWVRESILQLGPTFIKLGQLSSTRSDLLPAEFVEELSKLQDRVPAFSADKAEALIAKELGAPVNMLFRSFERRPIAAASLGQVHRAVLFNGERVVVKVQRPGLKELFDIDLENLKLIAGYFQRSESLGGPTRDWLGIYEECKTILYEEIDYINEGRNADRFRSDFRKVPWVTVPAVYWDYVSTKVLTLEYAPGIKVNDVSKLDDARLDRALIAQHAIEAYLIQILRTGFFHADPHPGNVAVHPSSGALIYYDFGMMGEIKAFTKDKLLAMFYAVYEKDAKKVRRSIQYFLDNLTGPQADPKNTIGAIGEDLFSIAVDQPFRFPATFTFVLRAFSTLEGVGKTLDPDFSFPRIAAPYAQELLDIRNSGEQQGLLLQRVQKEATQLRDATVSMPSRVERMDDIIRQLEAGDIKLRVRVLEAERADRRAGVLQTVTINSVAAAALLNIGVTLNGQGAGGPATASFLAAGVLAVFTILGMKRVNRLDKFEKML